MSEISLKLILTTILKNVWIVIICIAVCATASYVYFSSFVAPVYKADASIIISNGAISTDRVEYIASSNLSASVTMLTSCVDLLNTKNAYDFLEEEFETKLTAADYAAMTNVSVRSEESLFIDISVSNTSKATAVKVANAFAQQAPSHIKKYLPSAEVTVVQLSSGAYIVSPKVALMTIAAAALGAVLSIGVLVVIALFDNTVKGEDDLTENYNVPVLGSVPDFDLASK